MPICNHTGSGLPFQSWTQNKWLNVILQGHMLQVISLLRNCLFNILLYEQFRPVCVNFVHCHPNIWTNLFQLLMGKFSLQNCLLLEYSICWIEPTIKHQLSAHSGLSGRLALLSIEDVYGFYFLQFKYHSIAMTSHQYFKSCVCPGWTSYPCHIDHLNEKVQILSTYYCMTFMHCSSPVFCSSSSL